MSKKNLIIVVTLLFLLITYKVTSADSPLNNEGKAIMVIIDMISIDELMEANTPNIDRLLEDKGSIGIMNTNTGGGKTPENCALSISAGTRGKAPSDIKGFNSWEDYQDSTTSTLHYQVFQNHYQKMQYLFLTLIILSVQIFSPLYGCSRCSWRIFKKCRLKTALIGNADTVFGYRRYSTLIAMDSNGIIPSGDISSNCLINDFFFPYSLRTDYDKIFNIFKEQLAVSDFLVIDTGDTSRLEEYKNIFKPEIYKVHKNNAINKADKFIGKITQNMDLEKDLLIITSITPSK